MTQITRRIFLHRSAAVGLAGAGAAATEAQADTLPAMTPDERIAAAVEEIKAAYQEKFPNVRMRICVNDGDAMDFVMVLPFAYDERTGVVTYMRNNEVVRREGGAA